MFSSEIRETVFIAISLFVAAMVLGLVAIVIDLRGDFASIRNEEISTTMQMKAYREYNNYNDKIITSEEVIALITKYYDSGIEIYFNDNGKQLTYSVATVLSNPNIVGIDRLMQDIGAEGKHWVGITYDYQDVRTVYGPSDVSGGYYTDVTGIVILDSSVAP